MHARSYVSTIIIGMLSCAFLMMSSTPMAAIPAKRMKVELPQPDGTTFQAFFQGDEFLHGLFTAEGWPVVEGEDHYYRYGLIDEGRIKPTRWVVNGKLTKEVECFLRTQRDELVEGLAALRKKALACYLDYRPTMAANAVNLKSEARPTLAGERKALVILVQFSNLLMLNGTPAVIQRMFNQKGYNDNGHIGSVSDYFRDQSYGRLQLDFDVAGPVTLSQSFGYYGSNDPARGGDKFPALMVAEACRMVDGDVDFSDYDWDGDGKVEQVFIVYAGHGESEGAPKHTIWPHKSSLSVREKAGDGDGVLVLDEVKVDVYACACELAEAEGEHLNGIGTACHELNHCLGLPDLYDTAYSGVFGMGMWDVMDAGSRNGPNYRGEVPCGYSAFERYLLGWLQLEEVDSTRRITDLHDLNDGGKAYVVRNTMQADECFVLENHQPRGWFAYAGKQQGVHGLMVTHVDYDEEAWRANLVNTGKHQRRMGIVPADNDFGTYVESAGRFMPAAEELAGDLFPGAGKVEALTAESHKEVGGRWYHPTNDGSDELNVRILNMKEYADGVMAFDIVTDDDVPTPKGLYATNITHDGFTANWSEDDEADSYMLELMAYQSFWPFLEEKRDTISDLHSGGYVFCDLQGFYYAFRVKAFFNGIASEWSDTLSVSLDMTNLKSSMVDPEVMQTFWPNGIKGGKMGQGGLIIFKNNQSGTVKKMMSP